MCSINKPSPRNSNYLRYLWERMAITIVQKFIEVYGRRIWLISLYLFFNLQVLDNKVLIISREREEKQKEGVGKGMLGVVAQTLTPRPGGKQK